MAEFEELLGDMGAKQWVRNKFVAKLRTFKESGSRDVDVFVAEFNQEIFNDFKKLASEEVERVIKQASELMPEEPQS